MTCGRCRETPMESYLLAFAYLLGALNYYLGVALISLPVGRRLKGVGWTMLYDGAVYIVFTSAISLLPAVVHSQQVWGSLYRVGWVEAYSNLYTWLDWEAARVSTVLSLLTVVNGAIASLGLYLPGAGGLAVAVSRVWSGFWGPTSSFLSTLFFLLLMLRSFTAFIQAAWYVFACYGALIYGLPSRIGRRAGAGMIAFPLVFYLGLPLMPGFVDACTSRMAGGELALSEDLPQLRSVADGILEETGRAGKYYDEYGEAESPGEEAYWAGRIIDAFRGIRDLVERLAGDFDISLLVFRSGVLPLLFILILLGLSAGLARALGGAPLRPPGL